YIRDEAIDTEATALEERNYGVATAGLEWRTSRSMSLAAEYNYTNQKLQRVEERKADSNSVQLSVIYEPKRPGGSGSRGGARLARPAHTLTTSVDRGC